MLRSDGKTRLIATGLSFLAGYVDAIGFMGTGGFFVSFMSGNSTRLGVGIATSAEFAFTAAALILTFLMGVICASLLNHLRQPQRQSTLLILIAACLALAAAATILGSSLWRFLPLAFAMGAENMVFESEGEVRIGLTYMTGTLVKIGQRMATTLRGGPRWDWAPFLLLWSGLIAGGAVGALSYVRIGLTALWGAVGLALVLAAVLREDDTRFTRP